MAHVVSLLVPAIHAVLSIFQPGDRIIAGDNVYGGSYSQLNEHFNRWGLLVDSVDTCNLTDVERAVAGHDANGRFPAKAIYFETITNPLLKVNDVYAIAEIAHRYGAIVIVDNTFVTPYLQNPLDLGGRHRTAFGYEVLGRTFRCDCGFGRDKG